MRAAIGQRVYFSAQRVGLPPAFGETLRTYRQTDVLGALSGRVWSQTYLDTAVQYNTRDNTLERFNISTRYQPETAKVLNAGYRYTRDQIGQIDLSGQWPVSGGWYGVGRYNYSTYDKRLVESVLGFEYDGGCWVGRVVVQRLATQTNRVNNSIFFQLELNGLAKLGSNPLDLLKRTVPGYGIINQPAGDSNPFLTQ
jgi:LPS-assembly protein